MKIIKYFIVNIFLLMAFTSCGKQQPLETDMAPDEIATVVMESQTGLPTLRQIGYKDKNFQLWLSDYYVIQAEKIADGAVYCADGVEASEIAVLELEDENDSKTVKTALEEYLENRAGVFEGYAPKQAALAKNGIVIINGKYAALLACQDIQAAETAFLECFNKNPGESKKQPVEKQSTAPDTVQREEEAYDSTAVLEAWRSGDDSHLKENDLCILNVAKNTIKQQIKDTMGDYEKELAIHDWITGWSDFDYGIFDRSGNGFKEGSDTPYGVLIDREAMCHGYSSAFQLFMDMLGIECITVFGTPDGTGAKHSWNMVKLEDEWYCVDTAWDDPIGGNPGHSYFNVTSKSLRQGSIHRWDETLVPEATGTKYAYDSIK